jgi:hypothetical protein
MATKLLPTEYLGANYSGDGSTGVVSFDIDDFVAAAGLAKAEIPETGSIDPENLVTGLTYTITTLGDTDWTSLGCPGVPGVGSTFTASDQAPAGTTGVAKSGDIRRLMLGILEQVFQKYTEYVTAGTAPLKMVIARDSVVSNQAAASTVVTRTYTVTFQTDLNTIEVVEEA